MARDLVVELVWVMNKGFVTAAALVAILSDEVEEPVNAPLLIPAGNVTAPFSVSLELPRLMIPLVCVKSPTTNEFPRFNVCPARLKIRLLNVLAAALAWLMNIELLIVPEPPIFIEEVAEPVKLPLLAAAGKVMVPFTTREVAPTVMGPLL